MSDPAWGPGHVQSEFCTQDVHNWFELSYASYLVWPRLLMDAMPAEWQHRFHELATEIDEVFRAPLNSHLHYEVRTRDDAGRYAIDRLRDYRYGRDAVEDARL